MSKLRPQFAEPGVRRKTAVGVKITVLGARPCERPQKITLLRTLLRVRAPKTVIFIQLSRAHSKDTKSTRSNLQFRPQCADQTAKNKHACP